jgi:hypothetical protein
MTGPSCASIVRQTRRRDGSTGGGQQRDVYIVYSSDIAEALDVATQGVATCVECDRQGHREWPGSGQLCAQTRYGGVSAVGPVVAPYDFGPGLLHCPGLERLPNQRGFLKLVGLVVSACPPQRG